MFSQMSLPNVETDSRLFLVTLLMPKTIKIQIFSDSSKLGTVDHVPETNILICLICC